MQAIGELLILWKIQQENLTWNIIVSALLTDLLLFIDSYDNFSESYITVLFTLIMGKNPISDKWMEM